MCFVSEAESCSEEKVSQISRGRRLFYKQRIVHLRWKYKKYNIFFYRFSIERTFKSSAKLLTWFSPNSVAQNSTIKDVPSIEITTSGRETSEKVKDISQPSWQEFYFLFLITFCIKLKSFFSLQHTLSCESDVKEVKRVGQKTLWRHNILQAYKVQKVEKLRRESICI